jgi:DNA-binding transcriptional LysR family regulator
VTFGRAVLAPVVCDVLAEHPGLTASLVLLDRVVHLVDEGMDIAVRIGALPDSSLVARRIGEVRHVLVASPAYLERQGTPRLPVSLKQHATIAFTGLMPQREWRFGPGERRQGVALEPTLEVNDALAAIEAAERGHGITIALSYMVSDRVRAGTLLTVLDDHMPPPVPVHLVHTPSRPVAPKVRAFVDAVAPRLKQALVGLELARS